MAYYFLTIALMCIRGSDRPDNLPLGSTGGWFYGSFASLKLFRVNINRVGIGFMVVLKMSLLDCSWSWLSAKVLAVLQIYKTLATWFIIFLSSLIIYYLFITFILNL